MFCKNCGTDVGDNKFCSNCGTEVAAESAQNTGFQQQDYEAAQNTYIPNHGFVDMPFVPIEDFNLITAFASFFKKYVDFKGRSRRKEYWLAMLANTIITGVLSIIYYIGLAPMLVASINAGYGGELYSDAMDMTANYGFPVVALIAGILLFIYSLAVLIPGIAIVVRRLHDIGKSGWFYLISLIPCGIGAIILLIFLCTDSQPGVNKYGPNPKGIN